MNWGLKILLPFLSLMIIAGCSNDLKSSLGLRKQAPDEFVVISNPPLSMPPEFSLQQPSQLQPDGNANPALDKEKKLSTDEQLFLKQLESDGSSGTNAKKIIDQDNLANKSNMESKGAISKALSKLRGDEEDKVIDPAAERKRLQENQQQDKPINEGEVKNKSTSTIDRLFSK